MEQIIQFDNQLMEKILILEEECQKLSEQFKLQFQTEFQQGQSLSIDVVRLRKGKEASSDDLFEEDYESFIEIGLEHDGEYFPNGYIPLWKCKCEWLQKTGYLTCREIDDIKKTLTALLNEMVEDYGQEGRERD